MKEMKTLTVNGITYAVTDPNAARIDDSAVGADAWSAKKLVDTLCPAFSRTGTAVTCHPVEGYPLEAVTDAGATKVYRSGKNLFNVNTVRNNGTQTVNNGDGTLTITVTVAGAGVGMHQQLKAVAPGLVEGETYVLSAKTTGTLKYIYLSGANEIWYFGTAKTMTKARLDSLIAYYAGDPLVAVISEIQIERGTVATDFESFVGFDTFAVGNSIPALPGVNYIWADAGDVTVTGKADPVAIINKLTNAIVALGGTV